MAKRASPKLTEQGEALKKKGKKWLDRIASAWKREDDWAKDAEAAVKAYTNEKAGTGKLYDYNIFHANVETIVPAIINSPPVPDVRRRFGDADEVARTLSDIIERSITVQVDDSRLQTELEGQAQDGFMAGRGVIRLRFHADTVPTETNALEEAKDEAEPEQEDRSDGDGYDVSRRDGSGDLGSGGLEGNSLSPSRAVYAAGTAAGVQNERISFEAVSWRDYQHGPATRWEDRPWESYRHVMLAEDVKDFADGTMASLQTEPGGTLYNDMSGDVVLYEIWDKTAKKVCFIDDNGKYLKEIDDPLGWSGFFPATTPVQPIELVGRLMPVVPFSIYKKLADELDIITKRIRVLTDAMKIKGGILGMAADIQALADADDNTLITLSNLEQLAQMPGGLEKAVLWWPVDRFFQVLAELFKNRDLTKQAIYEITGISDVVRGASKASETLGAQQIKTQWGALRIQKMQRMMERSARDLFVMMAEIIPAKFSHETLERMTGIPILLRPTDTPEQIQQKQQLHQLMKERVSTYYRIDVESESTIRADLTMKKQEAGTFLDASAKYFASVGPLVQMGQLPAEAAIEIYAANARLFNLGKSTEDVLEGMVKQAKEAAKNPQPKPPSPEEIKAKADADKAAADAQATQAQQQIDMQTAQNDGLRAQQEAQAAEVENAERMQAVQSKDAKEAQERDLKAAEAQAKREADAAKAARDAETAAVDLRAKNIGLAIEAARLAQLMQPKPAADGEGQGEPGVDADEVAKIIEQFMPEGGPAQRRHEEMSIALAGAGQALAQLLEGQARLETALAQLTAYAAAPVKLDHDPQTGRVVGGHKVLN